jgi:hypothetical protein
VPALDRRRDARIEKSLAETIQQAGIDILASDLKRLGVKSLRGRLRREMIAGHIITLGFYLRMMQTSEINDETFDQYSGDDYFRTRETAGDSGQWAWSAYPL